MLSTNRVLAPMAGITDSHFRMLIQKIGGCGLVHTGMVSAEALVRGCRRTRDMMGFKEAERPLGVQIFGSRAESMAYAARVVEEAGADLVDINMGCPVRKVTRQGAGVALMRDVGKASALVHKVAGAVNLPVTVKIRSGFSPQELNAVEFARSMWRSGAAAVTVHPRAGTDGFEKPADWRIIAAVKGAVEIPVIGNGDISHFQDAGRMVEATGCDGVMIGRGMLRNPWLFREIEENREVRPKRIAKLIREHFSLLLGEVKNERRAVAMFRKYASWYSRGIRGAAIFRRKLQSMNTAGDLLGTMEAFFGEGS